MKRLISFIALALTLTSCSNPIPIKSKPAFGPEIENAEVHSMVREYFVLSTYYNIHFYNNVTIGLSDINHGNIVGLCTYGGFFREVDLDSNFWRNANKRSKLALVFHELTHCYCTRGHDYGFNKNYPEKTVSRSVEMFINKLLGKEESKEGYLADGCPASIMHPIVLDPTCFQEHYFYYIEEMFDRCDAW